MKVKNFAIKSLKEGLNEFVETFEALQSGRKVKPKRGVYFTSLEAVRNFLTPRRLELLRLIRLKHPRSLYELTKIAERSFPSVLRDVEMLKKHGLLTLEKPQHRLRNSFLPRVDYEAISLTIGL